MPIKTEGESMSVFERRRRENIEANRAVLTDISVQAKKVIPEKKPTTRSNAPKRAPRRKTVTPAPTRATRTSSRLAGLDADDHTLKRKMEVEAETQAEAARAKKMRMSGDLNLGDILVEGKKFGGIDGIQGLVRGAQPGTRTFTEDDVKETTSKELKQLRERMGALDLYEHWAPNEIKIVPQRVYALGFHPTEDKPIVFAGDKEGNIGVFDGSQAAPELDDDDEDVKMPVPVISAFKSHARTITSFVFSPTDSNAVFTSSYDSSIRKMDLEKGKSVQIWAPEDADEDLPVSSLDMPYTEPNLLFFSTLDGAVGRYDMRDPKSQEIWRLCDHKIGGFSLHPLQPHLLATASLDRTLKIWDTRKISGKGDMRHPALMGEHESRLSVSHASWSAGGQIATSSYDDTIKIYDIPNASSFKPGQDITSHMEPTYKIKHNNQTGRWVTILKPQWQKRPNDGIQKLVIGNMNRFVDMYASDGTQLAQLGGEGITAVPAVAHLHPSMNWVAGANSSGKLCLWR